MLDINGTILPPRSGQQHNVQCAHAVYHHDIEDALLPRNRTFYTTIIRSPASLFKSSFMFFGLDRINSYNFNLTLEESVRRFLNRTSRLKPTNEYMPLTWVINSLAHDLGFTYYLAKNGTMKEKIEQFISKMKEDFDFVMINEYFDESLVLLKSYMNWDYIDILYLNRLVSSSKRKKEKLSEEVIKEVKFRCQVDVKLYEVFLEIFHQRVAEYGRENLARDVEYFRRYRLSFEDGCFDKAQPIEGGYHSQTWNFSTHGRSDPTCQLLQYTDSKLASIISHLQVTEDFKFPEKIEIYKKKPLPEESISLIKTLQTDYMSHSQ